MSLKAFHVVFITLSVILAFALGIWGLQTGSATGNTIDLGLGVIGFVVGIALIIYEILFLRKLRDVSYL